MCFLSILGAAELKSGCEQGSLVESGASLPPQPRSPGAALASEGPPGQGLGGTGLVSVRLGVTSWGPTAMLLVTSSLQSPLKDLFKSRCHH